MNEKTGKKSSSHRVRFYAIVAGALLGILLSVLVPEAMLKTKFLGTLFLNALKMLIVPLVMASMIAGIGRLGDVRRLGKLGSYTIIYYLTTTFVSVLIGLVLVVVVQPGVGASVETEIDQQYVEHIHEKAIMTSPADAAINLLMKIVTPNIIKAMIEMDMLPIIIFSLIFGAILTMHREKGKFVLRFFDGVNDAILTFVQGLMWLAPVGIFALVGARLAMAILEGNFAQEMVRLFKYAMVVLGGLAIHCFIVLPAICAILAKRNPFSFMRSVAEPLLTAMSTASSSATLPITLQTLERQANITPKTAGFVATLGATINMDGTALYEAVAAVFIAQVYGIELGFVALTIVFLTATLAAIGAAGIPEAGLVTMIMVLTAVGLPIDGIAIILSIDWFLDRCRTTVNVWGDCVGCAIIDYQIPDGDAEAILVD